MLSQALCIEHRVLGQGEALCPLQKEGKASLTSLLTTHVSHSLNLGFCSPKIQQLDLR